MISLVRGLISRTQYDKPRPKSPLTIHIWCVCNFVTRMSYESEPKPTPYHDLLFKWGPTSYKELLNL